MDALSGLPGIYRRRKRRPVVMVILAASAAVTLGAGTFSLATFTGTVTSTGAFTTGTIDIATSPAALFTLPAIFPGSSGNATLNIANGGTGALRYAMTAAATNADAKNLRDQLQLAVSTGACPGGGALFGPAALSGAAFGNPAQGSHAGDRTLAAGANEDLCFAWSLDLATGNAFQAAATTATFTFAAEQTANNP